MTIMLDDLGDGYPTFPQFQVMLREYERDLEQAEKRKPQPEEPPPVLRIESCCPSPRGDDTYPLQSGYHHCLNCGGVFKIPDQPMVSIHAHRIGGPEVLGVVHHCRVCGKYFDGGVGAVCDR